MNTTKIIAVAAALASAPALATDDHHRRPPEKPPQVIFVDRHDHDELVGALIGAGVTYWLVHRHKRAKRSPALVPSRDAECDERAERVVEVCVAK